jgi:hypothetical protein
VIFDVVFLAQRPEPSWEPPAVADGSPLTDGQVALWDRLEARVRAILPAVTVTSTDGNRKCTDVESGLQLSFFAALLTLTMPTGDGRPDAARHYDQLRGVAGAVEHETGLTAFDRRTSQPFLDAPAPMVLPMAPSRSAPSTAPAQSQRQSQRQSRGQAPDDTSREPKSLILKVMLVSYAVAAIMIFTPAGAIGAVAVIVMARLALRIWWRGTH